MNDRDKGRENKKIREERNKYKRLYFRYVRNRDKTHEQQEIEDSFDNYDDECDKEEYKYDEYENNEYEYDEYNYSDDEETNSKQDSVLDLDDE